MQRNYNVISKLPNQVKNDLVRSSRKRRGRQSSDSNNGRAVIYGRAFQQLRQDVSTVMKYINVETKYVDTSQASTAMINGWQSTLLNGISQGTTSSTRSGQSVKCVGLEFKFRVLRDSTSLVAEQAVRVIIFKDKAANATGPTITDVFPQSTVSLRTVAYLDRFLVLYDEALTLSLNSEGSRIGGFSMPLQWHEEFNTGNAGTVADITVNSLYIAWTSTETANFPLSAWNVRFCFVDN